MTIRNLLKSETCLNTMKGAYTPEQFGVFLNMYSYVDNLYCFITHIIRCGLRNLFLMSGLFFLDDSYWIAIAKAFPELQALAQNAPAPVDGTNEDAMIWHL